MTLQPLPQLREIEARPGVSTDGAASRPDPALRLPRLHGAPRELARALRELDIVCIGSGSIGAQLAMFSAQVGVRSLVIVDRATLKPQSLLTHTLVAPGDVGALKAQAIGDRAKALSPETRVWIFPGDVAALPIHALAPASHILLASDNLTAEAIVSQRSLHLGVPVIQASVHGPTLTAQVRAVWGGSDGAGPNLCCGFGLAERAQLDAGGVYSCSGESDERAQPAAAPTMSPSFLCTAAASLAFLELARRAVGLVDPSHHALINWSGYTFETHTTHLARRADCFNDHECFHRVGSGAELGARTPRSLLDAAGLADANHRRISLRVDGYQYAALAYCGCRVHPVIGLFVPSHESAGAPGARCRRCDAPWSPHPIHVHEEVPVSLLEGRLDHSLAALGVSSPTSVRVRSDTRAALFVSTFPPEVL